MLLLFFLFFSFMRELITDSQLPCFLHKKEHIPNEMHSLYHIIILPQSEFLLFPLYQKKLLPPLLPRVLTWH